MSPVDQRPPNNGMQRTALRAAADAERSADCLSEAGSGCTGYYSLSERKEELTSLNAKNQGHPWAVPGLLHQLRL